MHQHQLKNLANQRSEAIISNRQNLGAGGGIPHSSDQQHEAYPGQTKHKTWKEHQTFLQKLKMARLMDQRNNERNARAGLDAFDFQVDDLMNDDPSAQEDEE